MSDSTQKRQELLAALAELSRMRPEWRLGQTMTNLAMTAGRFDAGGVWDLEDDEALAAARTLIEQHSNAAERNAALMPNRDEPADSAPHGGIVGGRGR